MFHVIAVCRISSIQTIPPRRPMFSMLRTWYRLSVHRHTHTHTHIQRLPCTLSLLCPMRCSSDVTETSQRQQTTLTLSRAASKPRNQYKSGSCTVNKQQEKDAFYPSGSLRPARGNSHRSHPLGFCSHCSTRGHSHCLRSRHFQKLPAAEWASNPPRPESDFVSNPAGLARVIPGVHTLS